MAQNKWEKDLEELLRHRQHLQADEQARQSRASRSNAQLEEYRMAPLFSWDAKQWLQQQEAEGARRNGQQRSGAFAQYAILGRNLTLEKERREAEDSQLNEGVRKMSVAVSEVDSDSDSDVDSTPEDSYEDTTPGESELEDDSGSDSSDVSSDEEETTRQRQNVRKAASSQPLVKKNTLKDSPSIEPVYLNTDAPWSAFLCGSQGSGKSHSLSCILENCLIRKETLMRKVGTLPKPLGGIVFHYDPHGGICEAAHLCTAGVPVRLLLAGKSQSLRSAYETIQGSGARLDIRPFKLQFEQLTVQHMLDLMGFDETESAPPLYMTELVRVLREVYMESDSDFFSQADYEKMKFKLTAADLTPMQKGPLNLRFMNLESYLPMDTVVPLGGKGKNNPHKKFPKPAEDWLNAESGTLTIIDLSDPFTPAWMACTLFRICLEHFLKRKSTKDVTGRLVALDEAHKYMHDTPAAAKFTEALLSTIRMQRHVGARIVIATQEPTISPKLLDLCTMTIVHRFTSPSWLATLRGHIAGLSVVGGVKDDQVARVFEEILNLGVGESLVFSPAALMQLARDERGAVGLVKMGNAYLKMKTRPRISSDGGRSLYASENR